MKTFKHQLFKEMPVIGILRGLSFAEICTIIPEYIKAGLTTLEITLNSPDVALTILKLGEMYPNLNIGAGTVCDMNDLELALNAGASFIVTPILDEEVVRYCKESEIPIFPGAFTPLEIFKAARAGATAVKVFPATQLGPQYIKDILAPLNLVKLLPTGGVNLDNLEAFFEAGVSGVGMGSSLFPSDLMQKSDKTELYLHFCKVVEIVKKYCK